ncbi:MAG: adenine deaminase C-terminal domain-containing protein [Flexilinea sp.]
MRKLKILLQLDETLSLGELDPSKVLGIREEYLEKILATLKSRRICNGHAIGLSPAELNIYAAGHLADDHECVTFEELRDRLRVGICALVREGSSERNTERLMRGVIENGLSTENLMFCTDDKHVNDIFQEGHISFNIQKSVDLGLDPVDAIKMATINAAKHFHVETMLGSLTPGRYADIVLLEDLKKIKPARVFKGGQLVAENGIAFPAASKKYPANLFDTVKLSSSLSAESFRISASGKRALCRIISLIPDQIINREEHEWMNIRNGQIEADPGRDILKLAVVERHGKNGRVSTALVRGFGLKKGALASSVSHDHHNIVVVGCNEQDMLCAVKALSEMSGGFAAACEGQIVDALPLPLAGLMSVLPAREVMERMNKLNEAAHSLGVTMASPFMTLSFISLPTVPELGLTDFGLINVHDHCITNLILQNED